MKYQIRELSLGGILDQSITLTKNHFGQFLALTSLGLLTNCLMLLITLTARLETISTPIGDVQQAVLEPWQLKAVIGLMLANLLSLPLTNAAIVNGIAQTYLGRPISFGDAMGRAVKSILPLFGTWILLGLVIMLGLVMLVGPAILFAFWYGLATQVVVLEKISGWAALKRSKALMKGNMDTLFMLGLILGVFAIALQVGVGFIPQPHLKALVAIVGHAVITIVNSAAVVVFYFSCRCKHEAFDLQLLAEAVGADPVEDAFEIDDAQNS